MTYDVMEHLTQVSMPRGSITQTRTFNYDSGTHLLTSEIHPETGTTSYAYFTAGNPDPSTYDLLYSKTDAKGQVTKYDYDAYDRVTAVHRLPNGTTEDVCQRVTYTYDATPGTVSGFVGSNTWGHVAAVVMGDPSNPTACQVTVHGYTVPQQFSELYSYNAAGHVTTKRLELDQPYGAPGAPGSQLGQWWDVGYTFNALGQMVTTSYPGTGGSYPATGGGTAGQTYTVGYDNMDRPANIKDSRVGSPHAVSGVIYNAADQPIQTQFQVPGGYLWENRGYNVLNQLTGLNNFNTSATVVNGTVGLTYTYSGTQNNGQITGGTTGNGSVTNTFTYDALKRLTAATAVTSGGATQWAQTYSYDGFGNMTAKSGSGLTFSNPGLDQTTNRLVGTNVCYDGDGNLTSDQNGGGCMSPNYGYDVANRMVSAVVSGGTEHYIYDADNKRISTISASGTQTVFIYGAMGEKLTVVPFGLNISNNVYFSGRLIKQGTDQISVGGDLGVDTNFVAVDRLGSVKATYLVAGTAYMPYGEEVNPGSNDRIKFTTYTRDASTGLDYADQRFYTSQFGRFMSADRFKQAAKANDSGSWNKYSYTRGDPVNRIDVHGTCDENEAFFDASSGSGDTGCDDNSGGGGGYDSGVAATCAAVNLVYDPNSNSCVEPEQGTTISPQQPECFAQLKDRPVSSTVTKLVGATHSFWWVQDANGNQWIISGVNQGTLNVQVKEGNANGADNSSQTTFFDSGLSADICDKVAKLLGAALEYPNAILNYNGPLGPNSNSIANYFGSIAGFSIPNGPSGSYGWGNTGPIVGLYGQY